MRQLNIRRPAMFRLPNSNNNQIPNNMEEVKRLIILRDYVNARIMFDSLVDEVEPDVEYHIIDLRLKWEANPENDAITEIRYDLERLLLTGYGIYQYIDYHVYLQNWDILETIVQIVEPIFDEFFEYDKAIFLLGSAIAFYNQNKQDKYTRALFDLATMTFYDDSDLYCFYKYSTRLLGNFYSNDDVINVDENSDDDFDPDELDIAEAEADDDDDGVDDDANYKLRSDLMLCINRVQFLN